MRWSWQAEALPGPAPAKIGGSACRPMLTGLGALPHLNILEG